MGYLIWRPYCTVLHCKPCTLSPIPKYLPLLVCFGSIIFKTCPKNLDIFDENFVHAVVFCFTMNCNVITKIEVNQKNTSEWTDMGIVVCNVSFGGIFLSRKWFWSNRNPILGAVSVFKKGHPTEPSVVLFCTVVQARRGSPLFSYSNPQLFSEDRTKTQKPISRKYLILNC